MIEIKNISLCIFAGISAGIINTIAGSGSIITLSLLSLLGLPVQIANGTNRIGLFFQSSTSSYKFYKQGKLSLKGKFWLIVSSIVGAFVGVFIASQIAMDLFQKIVGVIFCLLFLVILFKPEQYVKKITEFSQLLPLIFGMIGFYAGFIQAGAGVFMLVVLNIVWGKTFSEINPLKVFIIFLINLIALIGYAIAKQVNWEFGISLAIGQIIGGLIGVKLNNLKNNIESVIRLLLLILILVSILKFWNFF